MKEFDKIFNEFIETLFKGIIILFQKMFKGITKLKTLSRIGILLLTMLIAWMTVKFKPRLYLLLNKLDMPIWLKTIIYIALLFTPAIYLIVLGGMGDKRQDKYYKIFASIGFKGKDGKYPYFLNLTEDKGKITYVFKSNIPLNDWQTAHNRLESGLDCTILGIGNKNSKKIVAIESISSAYKIPTMVKWDDSYISEDDGVIRVGEGALGAVEFNLNSTPHVLMAGETGSGKSVILRTCLWQSIMKGVKVYMIDFKGGVEFGKRYEAFGEVITERKRALKVLKMLCEENKARLDLFRDLEVKNLPEYNKKTGKNLCRIGVFCDEIAEMLDKKGVAKDEKPIFEELEGCLSTLARLSRATGINLFLGVQRPDANVLTGQIKNNVPVRISGRFADKSASEIVLGSGDAVTLPNIKGRFLFKLGNELVQFQAYYFDDDTMLRDIDVEVGDLLLDPPKSQKDKDYNKYYDKPIEESITDKKHTELDFDFKDL